MKFFILSTLLSTAVFAETVSIPNTWVMENVILDYEKPQPEDMPKRVLISQHLDDVYMMYASLMQNHFLSLIPSYLYDENFRRFVVGSSATAFTYYSVKDEDELSLYCASGDDSSYELPSGAKVQKVACSAGWEIFLVENVFRKLTLHQQVLILFHERLSQLRDKHGGKNSNAIAAFVSGLDQWIELAFQQQEGQLRVLTDMEVERRRLYLEAFIQINFIKNEVPVEVRDWRVYPNGGGLIHKSAEVDSSSIVGVTSIVNASSSVGAHAKILGTLIPSGFKIGDGVEIIHSTFKKSDYSYGEDKKTSVIGNDSRIDNSVLDGTLKIGENAKISDSEVCVVALTAGKNFNLHNGKISMSDYEGHCSLPFATNKDQYERAKVIISDNQELRNGSITLKSTTDFAPFGSKVLLRDASFKIRTDCYKKSWNDLLKLHPVPKCFMTHDKQYDDLYLQPFSKDVQSGIRYPFSQTIENRSYVKKYSNGSSYTTYYTLVRSWDLQIKVQEIPGASNMYQVYNERIVPVGGAIKRTIHLQSTFWGKDELFNSIKNFYSKERIEVNARMSGGYEPSDYRDRIIDIYFPFVY